MIPEYSSTPPTIATCGSTDLHNGGATRETGEAHPDLSAFSLRSLRLGGENVPALWTIAYGESDIRLFLKRGGRAPRAIDRVLARTPDGPPLDQASPGDLEGYVAWVEREPQVSAKTHLWAIRYYHAWTGNEEMHHLAGILREERIQRAPWPLLASSKSSTCSKQDAPLVSAKPSPTAPVSRWRPSWS